MNQVPAELRPTLDKEWRSFQTTLYRSEDYTLVRQRFGVWSGKRGPLIARFFEGEVHLESLQERVEALALPERVCFVQLPSWQVLFLKRFVLWIVAAVARFQVGALVYALLSGAWCANTRL